MSVVSGVNTDCVQRLWLAWRKIGGQMLPVFSRIQACAKLIAIATTVNGSTLASSGTRNPY